MKMKNCKEEGERSGIYKKKKKKSSVGKIVARGVKSR